MREGENKAKRLKVRSVKKMCRKGEKTKKEINIVERKIYQAVLFFL